ncbi:MAG: hypothetical protein RL168_876 [Bacteroidota bacterium]|jgi:copper homeostasis protein
MLEICTFSLEDAFAAVEAGAERLEICTDYASGGTTPPEEWIFALKHSVHVPMVAMVRPRGGHFQYTEAEWEDMALTGLKLRKAGAHALVFGGLTAKGKLDVAHCRSMIQRVGLPCVLHRAFDEIEDPLAGLEDAIACGFSRILTGWGLRDLTTLKLLKLRAGHRIEILPGGGIRSTNVSDYTALGFTQVHSSAIPAGKPHLDPGEVQAMLRQLVH